MFFYFFAIIFFVAKMNAGDPAMMFSAIITMGIYVIFAAGSFIVKAIALCRMAKKRGIKSWWMGMIPYLSYFVLGRLAGPVSIFRIDFKNIGIITAAAYFVRDVLFTVDGIFILLFMNIDTPVTQIISIVNYPFLIIYLISNFALLFAFFGKYYPQRRMLFTMLNCFMEFLLPFFLIALMNGKPYANAEEYYREQYVKRFGQQYNPYENPFDTRENPFNGSSGKTNESSGKKPDDPFDEF